MTGYESVREHLTIRRIAAGYSQRSLAERMNTAQTHICYLENGKVDPRISTLHRWAEALDLHLIIDLEENGEVPA